METGGGGAGECSMLAHTSTVVGSEYRRGEWSGDEGGGSTQVSVGQGCVEGKRETGSTEALRILVANGGNDETHSKDTLAKVRSMRQEIHTGKWCRRGRQVEAGRGRALYAGETVREAGWCLYNMLQHHNCECFMENGVRSCYSPLLSLIHTSPSLE
jgi:hypothetical protein